MRAADITKRIAADFGAEHRDKANAVINQLHNELGGNTGRLERCVVFLARGNLTLLMRNAELAKTDFRAVISKTENDSIGSVTTSQPIFLAVFGML